MKPQLVLNFANEDFLHLEPDWGTVAYEKQVVILRCNFKLCQNCILDPQVELSRMNRRNFMHYCFLAVNAISNFLNLESTCQQCGQERQVHVLIACEGSRKSVAILIVCMIFYGKFSCKSALGLPSNNRNRCFHSFTVGRLLMLFLNSSTFALPALSKVSQKIRSENACQCQQLIPITHTKKTCTSCMTQDCQVSHWWIARGKTGLLLHLHGCMGWKS